jgi:hypothetical protein
MGRQETFLDADVFGQGHLQQLEGLCDNALDGERSTLGKAAAAEAENAIREHVRAIKQPA